MVVAAGQGVQPLRSLRTVQDAVPGTALLQVSAAVCVASLDVNNHFSLAISAAGPTSSGGSSCSSAAGPMCSVLAATCSSVLLVQQVRCL